MSLSCFACKSVCIVFVLWGVLGTVCTANAADGHGIGAATVPSLVKMKGILRHPDGSPYTAPATVRFSLYSAESGGTPLWSEAQSVSPDASGYYSAMLGAMTGLPANVFAYGEPRWLALQIESDPEQPRTLLVSVPYALKAGDAATLNGLPASSFVRWQDLGLLPAASSPLTTAADNPPSTSQDPTGFVAKFADTSGTALMPSAMFDAGVGIGINTTAPVAVLDVRGDGTAEIISATADADRKAGLSLANSVQGWELAVRPDLLQSFAIRNTNTNSDAVSIAPDGTLSLLGKVGIGTSLPSAQLDVAGDIRLSSPDAGIVFPDGSRQETASNYVVSTASTPGSVVERDASGNIAANQLKLESSLQLPVQGYIATADAVDHAVGVIPKLFLSADGGPYTGVIPSLTFRSTNPQHIFGEVAFQDNTTSPGQDIWAIQQDYLMNHQETLAIRRRGQPVLSFWPLSGNGSDVLTAFSGTRLRFERSGPYPIEFRDTSFALPEGLWRMATSNNCWLVYKNSSNSGDFASNMRMLQVCPDGNLSVAAGLNINGGINSSTNLNLVSQRGIAFATGPGQSIRFTPGTNAFNVFNRPIGIGTSTPQSSLHVVSGGNLQDAIFASSFNANEGISIRNTVQNWALGVRADLGQSFEIRNITAGTDPFQITPGGDVIIAEGQLKATRGLSVGTGVDAEGSGLKHGRMAIGPVSPGGNTVARLTWKVPFSDAAYTATCAVVSGDENAGLRVHHLLATEPGAIRAVIANDDANTAHSAVLHCIAIHD